MPRNPTKKTVSPAVDRPLPVANPLPEVPSAPPIDEPAAVAVVERPKPKPPKKKAAPPTTSDLVDQEVAKQRQMSEAREELAFLRHTLLADGQDLSPDQFRLYQTAVPRRPNEDRALWGRDWDRHLRKEDSRVEQILFLQAAAGSCADQVKADKLVKDADAKRDKESPAIESEIRKLQAEWDALHQAATSAKSASEARHSAVAALRDRKLLPAFILDELNANCRRDTRSFGKALLQLETQQTTIQGILDVDVKTQLGRDVAKHHVGGNPRFGADEFARWDFMFDCETFREGIDTHCKVGQVRLDIWDEYLGALRIDLAAVDSQIAELTAGQQVDANRKADSLRSFYVPV